MDADNTVTEQALPDGSMSGGSGSSDQLRTLSAERTQRPLPGHPRREGAGYDCGCGACLAPRRVTPDGWCGIHGYRYIDGCPGC